MAARLVALALAAAVLRIGSAAADQRDALLVGSDALATRLAKGEVVLLDAETTSDYLRAHIPGALNLPYLELDDAEENAKTGRPIFPQLAASKLGELGIRNDAEIVVYDSGNGRGASAIWYILRYIGHDSVRVLDGGFRKWIKEGRPVSQDALAPAKTRYVLKTPRANWVLTTAQVQAGKAKLIDARSIAEFTGKEDGGARQSGHIPGAISFPWERLSGTVATFKDDATMRRELAQAGLSPDKEIVTYCNPGLGRSTFLLLAMTLLGYEKVTVYPGSYLEWASDPSRPVAR